MIAREVELLSEEGAKAYLVKLIDRLEEASDEGLFGGDNWEYALEMEDE